MGGYCKEKALAILENKASSIFTYFKYDKILPTLTQLIETRTVGATITQRQLISTDFSAVKIWQRNRYLQKSYVVNG